MIPESNKNRPGAANTEAVKCEKPTVDKQGFPRPYCITRRGPMQEGSFILWQRNQQQGVSGSAQTDGGKPVLPLALIPGRESLSAGAYTGTRKRKSGNGSAGIGQRDIPGTE